MCIREIAIAEEYELSVVFDGLLIDWAVFSPWLGWKLPIRSINADRERGRNRLSLVSSVGVY